jgi:hypothetical protein
LGDGELPAGEEVKGVDVSGAISHRT